MPPIPSPTYERLRHSIAKRMRMSAVHRRCRSSDAWAQPAGLRRHVADGLALHQPERSAVVELPHPIAHQWTSTC